MTSPRFLVDMNLSPKTVTNLQEHGWDILRVSQVLPMDAEDIRNSGVCSTRKPCELLHRI